MSDWGATNRGSYRDRYVVDGGKRRIILAVPVTPAEVRDSQATHGLL